VDSFFIIIPVMVVIGVAVVNSIGYFTVVFNQFAVKLAVNCLNLIVGTI